MALRQAAELDLKGSPDTPDHLDSKETEDLQVYPDPQEHLDSQLLVAVVSLDHRAIQESEVKREKRVRRGFLCQVLQDVRGLLVSRAHQDSPELQAIPQEDKTAWLENLGALVCREIEDTQEKLGRKVIKATPVSIALVEPVASQGPVDHQDSPDFQDPQVVQDSKEREVFQEHLVTADLLVARDFKVPLDSLERRESQEMPSQCLE